MKSTEKSSQPTVEEFGLKTGNREASANRNKNVVALRASHKNTSCLPEDLQNKPISFQLIGFLILFSSVGLFAWHFDTLIDKYNENSITTSIQSSSVVFDFPELLICNSVVFSFSTLVRNITRMEIFEKNVVESLIINSVNRGYSQLTDFMKIMFSSTDIRVLAALYGADINDMLIFCKYGSVDCTVNDFQEYIHDNYFRCWRFVPQNKTIQSNQLEMILFSDSLMIKHPDIQMQNIPFASLRYDGIIRWDVPGGINLFVYPIGVAPINAKRLQMGSGFEIQMSLNQMDISAQNSVQKPCETNISQPVVYYDIMGDKKLEYDYNIEDCYNNALLKEYERRCGCFPKTRIPIHFNTSGKGNCYDYNATIDGPYMLNRTNCLEQVKAQTNEIQINSNCKNSCKRRVYSSSISSSKWPLDETVVNTVNQFVKPAYKRLIAKGHYSYGQQYFANLSDEVRLALITLNNTDIEDSQFPARFLDYQEKSVRLLRDFSNNFLRLKIFSVETKGSQLEESFSYTLVSLMSDFGGIIGMYLGFSVMTIMEFAEFFNTVYKFIRLQIYKRDAAKYYFKSRFEIKRLNI